MFGYLSINLENELIKYINEKGLIVTYIENKPIDENNYERVLNDILKSGRIKTLIIDETIFYDSELIINFLKVIKSKITDLNIIYICFNEQNIRELARFNIYNIIYYPGISNLDYEIDDLLINPKELVDLSNLILAEPKSEKYNSNYLAEKASFDINVIATSPGAGSSFIAHNLAELLSKSEIVNLIENPFAKSLLKSFYNAEDYMTVATLKKQKYKIGNLNYIFSSEHSWNKEMQTKLLMDLQLEKVINIFDFSFDF